MSAPLGPPPRPSCLRSPRPGRRVQEVCDTESRRASSTCTDVASTSVSPSPSSACGDASRREEQRFAHLSEARSDTALHGRGPSRRAQEGWSTEDTEDMEDTEDTEDTEDMEDMEEEARARMTWRWAVPHEWPTRGVGHHLFNLGRSARPQSCTRCCSLPPAPCPCPLQGRAATGLGRSAAPLYPLPHDLRRFASGPVRLCWFLSP